MSFKKVFIPIALMLTLLLQFVPGTMFAPRPVAAQACDSAQFIADVTIPDGTIVAPGSTFVKTWRVKNIGSCTWSTTYSAVFISGSQLGAPAAINLPSSVAPGATVDISVNLTAPSGSGHYRGNWKLRNASGAVFGVGGDENSIFWVDINVSGSLTTSTSYDFMTNACSAAWSSGAGALPCPGTDGDTRGFVLPVSSPKLENGSVDPNPGVVVNPQQVAGGYIQGVFPAYTVQSGDHFQGIINCTFNSTNCYVNFRLMYQIGSGPVHTFWSFNERYDGLFFRFNLDLSSLAGQSVNFILYTADVSGHGSPSGDRAEWVETRIAGNSGGGSNPIFPSLTCNRGFFVGDVTIPDGTVMAPGTPFTKTWQIRNVGSCTWTTSYALVFVFGDPLGASSPVNLPAAVAPGATANFSVNMVAPSAAGHYRSFWRFQDASGNQFGVGSGRITFFADINVSGSVGSFPSTTTITAHNPNPSTIGQSVAVSATVTGSSSTPTGTVSITGADSNCTITLSGGSGTCNVIFTSTGAKTLTATYSGNTTYAGSSGTASHTVNQGGSTTAITAHTPNPSNPGQAVTVSVTVSGSGTAPTGTVAITGADTNCTITLASGSGSCNTVVFNTVGTKTLTATYSGNGNYTGSTGTASHIVSLPLPATTTSITSDAPDPSTPGQSVVVGVIVSGTGSTPTGTVAISGADSNCTVTLSGGAGSCNVVFNTPGSKTITATYSGDGSHGSSSDNEGHTVTSPLPATTTTITDDLPNPSNPGQVVSLTVSVIGAGTIPTGTVTITGADNPCTITLSGGTGTCTVVFSTLGSKTLTANYSGNANYAPSTGTKSHSVVTGQAVSATSITSSVPNPSTPGQAVVVTVTVTGAGLPNPSGNVNITGADNNCTLLLAAGTGSCSVVFNTTGHKTLTATYAGDGNYAPSSGTASQTVVKGSTTLTINSATPDPSKPTQAVAVSFTVIGAGFTPTGTVDVTGADINCTATLSGGSGVCNVVFNTIGAKNITATYTGDSNYMGSSDSVAHTVKNLTTTVITSDNPDPSTPGDSVLVTVTVTGPGTNPTGTVDITGANTNCTTGALAPAGPGSATASCSVTFVTAGAKTLTATYAGDANYVGSTGSSGHTVNRGPSTTIITVVSPEPSNPFQSVAVTVTVSGAGVVPTGTVGISMNGVPTSTCSIPLAGGTGTCSVVFNVVGTFTITATYNGDGNYLPSTNTVSHTVN